MATTSGQTAPPPLSTDLIDTRQVKFRTNANTGTPEVIPGSLTPSAPWLIWFNTIFNATSSNTPDSAVANLQLAVESIGTSQQGGSYGVISGTHATRAVTPAGGLNLNRIYFETDRHVIYVSMAGVWTFMAGIMVAATASRPADLTTADNGFFFLDSTTNKFQYWDGAAWQIVTPTLTSGEVIAALGYTPAQAGATAHGTANLTTGAVTVTQV